MKKTAVYNFGILLAVLAVGIVLAPLNLTHLDFSMVPGDLADTRFNHYILEHGYRWITGQVDSFWNAGIWYPVPNVTAYSDSHLGTFWIYSLFRVVNFDRETALQLWVIVLFIFNFIAAAYVLHKMGMHIIGVACGAFIFAFSMPVMSQVPRVQHMARFMVPFIFLYTMQYLDRPGVMVLLKLCLSLVLQFYCTFYIAYLTVIGMLSVLLGYLLLNIKNIRESLFIREFTVDLWKKLGVLAGSFLLLLPAMVPYIPVAAQFGYRKWIEISLMLPRISSYFFPTDGTLLWNWLKPVGAGLPMPWEHTMFAGVVPLMAVPAMFILYKVSRNRDELSKTGLLAAASLVILVVLTLSVSNFSLYRLIYRVIPGLSSLRAIARIILIDMFLFSIITGVVITRLCAVFSDRSGAVKAILALVLVAAVAADQYIVDPKSYSKKEAQMRSGYVENLMKEQNPNGKIYAYLPTIKIPSMRSVILSIGDGMMAAQNLNAFIVNGYSGNYSPEVQNLIHAMLYSPEERCLALRRWEMVTEKKYKRDNWYKNITVVMPGETNPCAPETYAVTGISSIDHPLESGAFNAGITFPQPVHYLDKSDVYLLDVVLENKSNITWPAMGDNNGKYAICLSYRYLRSDGKPMTGFDRKIFLLYDLKPHEKMPLTVPVVRPFDTGEYDLEFDLFQDSVGQFSERGSKTSRVKIIAKGQVESKTMWR